MSMPGYFISLDGPDGGGKSTQCQLLAKWLRGRGHQVTECVDPGGTAVGQSIRDILLDKQSNMTVACEMFLFMASRAQLTQQVIRPALAAGQIVVSDRYLLANVVYQGHAGGLDANKIWSIGRSATGGLLPDLTLVLDVPLETANQRRSGRTDRMESKNAEFHQRVRQGFLAEARSQPGEIVVVHASQPVEDVHHELRRAVLSHRPEL